MSTARYKINEPDVTFESFEGELLVINLGNGNYHSLRGSAVQIWPGLAAGQNVEEIAPIWESHGDHSGAIQTFVDQLVAAELIIPRGDKPIEVLSSPSAASEFTTPLLENYTDMQDLLMLDPIHEVDVSGWPKQAPEKPANP